MNAMVEMIAGYLHHSTFTAVFFDAWVKSLAVLAAAGGLCFLCRRAAAATRHWIWFLALASLLCLPMLSAVPRAWHRPLVAVSTGFDSGNQFSLALSMTPIREAGNPAEPVSPAGTSVGRRSRDASLSNEPVAAHFSTTFLVLAVVLWFIGTALGLASVLAAQIQLSRLAGTGLPLRTPDWALVLRETCETLRLRRPVRLLQSAEDPMPLTWGWWRPVVLLPADAEHWPVERRRIVLLHELAHVKRWDCLTQTVARIVCALFWINPLAWLAAHRMCVERELACDDLVLNSGCRASDYATHLMDIARAFRHAPRLAGIAMARSSKLQGRIAAIVDASRARRLRPFTALAIVALMGALALSVGGRSPDGAQTPPEDSALRQLQIARLQSFAQAKERQSRELAAKSGEQISSDFQSFFDAATKGDWQTVTNRYAYFKQHHPQYTKGTNGMEVNLRTAYWQPVLELCLAYDQVVNCEPKYTSLLATGIINSIPAGSIYFGGTDPGRGVPTAFCKSSIDGDPFFTLTQNALADGTCLEYLRAMYGGKIYTPSGEDSQNCFQEYMKGAMSRFQQHKLKPGENVQTLEVDGHPRVQVSGQVAVMSINGLLTKLVFDHNPDREFYVEESFPLDWMYPYLEPHGLIMKLNRQPLAQLSEATIARDREYWRKLVAGMLGDWLDEKTTVREVAEFVDRVYVRHNLKGFTGDPRFIQDDYAKRIFSKLRSSSAGVYAWRFSTNALPEY
ncbi:MAG: M56 family metallopeptidase, partial [Verrucomicrobia bacterium]|nr:M56 family metallopeptidase [Verrucomicrobiota bacterium]